MKKLSQSNKSVVSKINDINKGNEVTKEKIEKMEKKMNQYEREKKKRNIVIHGLEEKQNETWQEREIVVLDLLQKQINSSVQTTEIDSIRRVGIKKPGKCRPIVVSFTTLRRKLEILSLKRSLVGSKIYIQQDFSEQVLNKRKELQPYVLKLRKEGNTVKLQNDVMYVNGKEWSVDKLETQRHKRKSSESPEIYSTGITSTPKSKRTQKKSKGVLEITEYATDSDEFSSSGARDVNMEEVVLSEHETEAEEGEAAQVSNKEE